MRKEPGIEPGKDMTERIYYEDVMCSVFDAKVLSCSRRGDHYEIIPDRSAFYPEGGGQSGDRGFLLCPDRSGDTGENDGDFISGSREHRGAMIRVLDTHERDGDVILCCDAPAAEGERIEGHLDWEFRFDRMQNHTGEHIVSGLIHERFGYENVGFHMSSDRMTIDLSGEITEEEIREIERLANEIVWSDVPVYTDLYTEEEAEKVEFRSKKQLHGTIRVVRIPGADVCACCGTHVLRTGAIGSIRIISHVRFKGGVRMELMCGRWAYQYMTGIFLQNHEVSMALSAKMTETGKAAAKLLEEDAALKFRITQLRYSVIDRKARELRGTGDVLLFADDFSPLLVQKLTAKVMEECGGSCFSFSGTDEEGYRYAVGETGGDLKELVRKMNQQLNGRGGGKPFFLQGSVSASREEIERFLSGAKAGLQIVDL